MHQTMRGMHINIVDCYAQISCRPSYTFIHIEKLYSKLIPSLILMDILFHNIFIFVLTIAQCDPSDSRGHLKS